MLGPLCNHSVDLRTDSKTLYYSILKLKYSPSISKHNKGWKKYALLNNGHNNCQRNYMNKLDISTDTLVQIDWSIFASYRMYVTNIIFVFGDFYASGTQDSEVKKSLRTTKTIKIISQGNSIFKTSWLSSLLCKIIAVAISEFQVIPAAPAKSAVPKLSYDLLFSSSLRT